MKNKLPSTEDQIVDAVIGWMVLLWILFGVCVLGLLLTIAKTILSFFGIQTNL